MSAFMIILVVGGTILEEFTSFQADPKDKIEWELQIGNWHALEPTG